MPPPPPDPARAPRAAARIVPYDARRHRGAFRAVNEAWIVALFRLEPHDVEVLADPGEHVLRRGQGAIIVCEAAEGAAEGEVADGADNPAVLGACALVRIDDARAPAGAAPAFELA